MLAEILIALILMLAFSGSRFFDIKFLSVYFLQLRNSEKIISGRFICIMSETDLMNAIFGKALFLQRYF